MIRKIAIRNYRMFRKFDLEFSTGINILVGRNDTGKSTLIEAINLALTGRVHGRALAQELSPYHINLDATREYVQKLQSKGPAVLPTMIIDLFLEDADQAEILRGTNNVYGEDACRNRGRCLRTILAVIPQHRLPASRRPGASLDGLEDGGGLGAEDGRQGAGGVAPDRHPEVGDPRAGRLDVAPASPALEGGGGDPDL
ncbi:MAG: AAA family ATPase [candidate division NC10 bacterium]